MRKFRWLMGAELGSVVGVTLLFRLVEPKVVAALWAGALFVALGATIVLIGTRSREFRRTWTFRAGVLHLFATAIPLFITRLFTYGTEFRAVTIFGISGPVFHRLSEGVYLLLIAGTGFDLWSHRTGHRTVRGRGEKTLIDGTDREGGPSDSPLKENP